MIGKNSILLLFVFCWSFSYSQQNIYSLTLKIESSCIVNHEKDNINKYQLYKFLNYMIEKLENKKFFTPNEKKESMKNNIYSIFTKIPLKKKELQTLWGITKKLNKSAKN